MKPLKRMMRLALVSLMPVAAMADGPSLLNVSYDVSREFYKDYNALWNSQRKIPVTVQQSHGGSTKQVRAVLDGLEADVLTMNQALDLDLAAEKGAIAGDWRTRFPNQASPYASTMILLVRKGNPKKISDWSDLARPGVQVVMPHPKNTGNGRFSLLAFAGSLSKKGLGDAAVAAEVKALFANVPYLAPGGRDATTAFVQRGVGDVLPTFESEVSLIVKEGAGAFLAVVPPRSVRADAPVAVVEAVVKKHGTGDLAKEYLAGLWGDGAQELAARHGLRPAVEKIRAKNAHLFAKIDLFTVEEVFGSWKQAREKFFADGALVDRLLGAKK